MAFSHTMGLGAQVCHPFGETAFGGKYSPDLEHYITGLFRMLIKKIGFFSYLSHTFGNSIG